MSLKVSSKSKLKSDRKWINSGWNLLLSHLQCCLLVAKLHFGRVLENSVPPTSIIRPWTFTLSLLLSELSEDRLLQRTVWSCLLVLMLTTWWDDVRLFVFKRLLIVLSHLQPVPLTIGLKGIATHRTPKPRSAVFICKPKSMKPCTPVHHQKYMSKAVCQIHHWQDLAVA